jgi:hypothetical protein
VNSCYANNNFQDGPKKQAKQYENWEVLNVSFKATVSLECEE